MGRKIEELVIHISQKSENDPAFGLTKLNKILFAADFYYYGYFGKSITGEKYVHRKNGPVPQDMLSVLKELEHATKINIITKPYFGYQQKRPIPLSGANLANFSDDEINLVDKIIEYFFNHNGTDLSDWTHKLIPWLVTSEEEEIPYHSVFMLKNLTVERDGIKWGQEELVRLRGKENYAHWRNAFSFTGMPSVVRRCLSENLSWRRS